MKKNLLVLLFFAFAFLHAQESVSPIHGGTARTAALGGGPSNPYIKDYTDVLTNPAYALTYTDLLYSDIGYAFAGYTAAGQFVGYTLGLGNLAVGLEIGRREGPMFAVNSLLSGSPTFGASDYMTTSASAYFGAAVSEPRSPIQIYAAYKLAALTVGAALYRSGWSRTDDGTNSVTAKQKNELGQGQTGIKAGAILELSQTLSLDGSVMYRLNSSTIEFTDSDTGANPTSASYDATGNELAIAARMTMKLSDKIEFVPHVRFMSFSYQPELSVSPTPPAVTKPNDYGRSEFEVGLGLNSKFSDGWITIGLSFQTTTLTNDVTTLAGGPGSAQVTTKNSITWTDLPKINIGAEFRLLSWMTGRLGYFNRLSTQTTTTEPPAPGVKTETSVSQERGYIPTLGFTSAAQQLSLGLGIAVGRIAIDGYMGEHFLAAMPFVISGNTQDMFGVLSMSVRL